MFDEGNYGQFYKVLLNIFDLQRPIGPHAPSVQIKANGRT